MSDCKQIDYLRSVGNNIEANVIQYGMEGDYFDGHRCRVCGKLAGGDYNHRCWR
jgi:hypothetical protein